MKVGIVCDNYKLPKFRELLSKAGLSFNEAGQFTKKTTALTVETDDKALVQDICQKVEAWALHRQ